MALLIGGLFLGKNLLQEKQRPVEKKAEIISCPQPGDPAGNTADCGTQCCNPSTQNCCNSGCKPKSEGCEPGNEPIPSLPSPIPPPTPDAPNTIACGAQTCWKDTECCTLTGCHPLSDPACGGNVDKTGCSDTCCYLSNDDWNNGCKVYSYFCPNPTQNSRCGENQSGPSQSTCFSYSCGKEQIDLFCPGKTDHILSPSRPVCGSVNPLPSNPSGSPNPSPPASPPTSPPPSAPPSLACVDLTKDKTAPSLGDKVTFTCEAAFSSVSPVAFFRYMINEGAFYEDPDPYPIGAGKTASVQKLIDTLGNWITQCRVCTDSSKTTCTAWGLAN